MIVIGKFTNIWVLWEMDSTWLLCDAEIVGKVNTEITITWYQLEICISAYCHNREIETV